MTTNALKLVIKPHKPGALAIARTGEIKLICPDGYELPTSCIKDVTVHAEGQTIITASVEFFVITEEAECNH